MRPRRLVWVFLLILFRNHGFAPRPAVVDSLTDCPGIRNARGRARHGTSKGMIQRFLRRTSQLLAHPTQNIDTDMPIDSPDRHARFFVTNVEHSQPMIREEVLDALLSEWDEFDSRLHVPDTQWAHELALYLEDLAEMCINHIRAWVKSNLTRFQAGHANVMELQRTLESFAIDLKSSVQLCLAQCASCQLLCIQNRFHDGAHNCKTTHTCTQSCEYCAEVGELGDEKTCSMT